MLSAPTCFTGTKSIPLKETVKVLRAEIRPPKKMPGHPNRQRTPGRDINALEKTVNNSKQEEIITAQVAHCCLDIKIHLHKIHNYIYSMLKCTEWLLSHAELKFESN